MRIIIFVFLCACIPGACSTLPVKEHTEVTINPSLVYEDCVELFPRQVLAYAFDCTKSVDFNIHYREGSHLIYKMTKNNTTIHQGKFYTDKKQFYCLAWTNPHSSPTRLKYSFRVTKE